jgi:PAS domain S-box-containing protein
MEEPEDEDKGLRAAAFKNAAAILAARQRAERELIGSKEALVAKTAELKLQRESLEVTLSSIGDAVITTDTDGRVTFMNRVAEELTGWTAAEASGEHLESVFRTTNEAGGLQATTTGPEVQRRKSSEFTRHTLLTRKDGSRLSIEDSAAPIRDPNGGISGAVMVFHDVTARRRAEEALQASEERFRTAFLQAAVGIAVASIEGKFVEANPKFSEILGYSLEELRSMTFGDITHPEDIAETLRNVERLRGGDVPSYAMEKRYLRKDGGVVWSLTTVTLLKVADGTSPQFIGVIDDITERKRAEEGERRGMQRLELALAAGDLGDWSFDARTGLVTLSARAADIVGVSSVEPLPWSDLRSLLGPEDAASEGEAVSKALREQTVYEFERRVARPSGGPRWLAARGHGLYDANGAVTGMIGVVQDVTQRKVAEEARGRLAAVVDSSFDAILSKTLEGVITTWNQAAERMFGYTAEEAVGRSIKLLIPTDRLAEEDSILARLKRGERIEHFETVRRRKDGTLLNVSLSVSPLRDHTGTIIGAAKIARDITRQKEAEEHLLEERRILEVLNATGPAIASQLELEKLVQTVTDAATQLSGARFGAFFYNVTNQDGESFLLFSLSGAPREAFEGFGLPRNTPIFNPTFRGEGVVRSADITKDPRYGTMAPHHGMPKGHLAVRSYLAVPVRSRSGEVIGGLFFGHPEPDVFTERSERLVVGVAAQAAIAIDNARLYEAAQREIASRQRAEAALRETDRKKDEFLATLAHELRNPLAPIRQAALVSQSADSTEAQKRWSHDVISRQVHHMALLLDDLLDISRVTRGTLELRTEMTDLGAVVDGAIETARPSLDAKRHNLKVTLPKEPVRFAADPLRLAQVLSNLLTNAAKYTDPGGQIRIDCARTASEVSITVSDSGIGLPHDVRTAIFAMFAQVESGRDRSEGGLGIGLALAKGLVELHGGTIEVASEGPGQGSQFTVRLPIRTLDSKRPKKEPAQGGAATIPRRVLIADDNRDAAESLAMLLRIQGHDVAVVHDGREALIAFDRFQPEVALLDIGMPEVNGYEVARIVRQGTLGRAVTLIAVTGWGQDGDKAEALAAGFNHHFTKPIEPDQLSALIRADGERRLRPQA